MKTSGLIFGRAPLQVLEWFKVTSDCSGLDKSNEALALWLTGISGPSLLQNGVGSTAGMSWRIILTLLFSSVFPSWTSGRRSSTVRKQVINISLLNEAGVCCGEVEEWWKTDFYLSLPVFHTPFQSCLRNSSNLYPKPHSFSVTKFKIALTLCFDRPGIKNPKRPRAVWTVLVYGIHIVVSWSPSLLFPLESLC